MNRYNQLVRLKDEVAQLFDDGLSESAIFGQLHADPRFATVSRTAIQSFYKRMEEKTELDDNHELQRIELEEKHEHKMAELEEKRKRKVAKFERKMVELERIKQLCQSAENFLFYDAYISENMNIWQSRFILNEINATQHDNTHKVELLDLYQRESKTFPIPSYDNLYALKYPFLLLDSYNAIDGTDCFHLAHFNPERDSMQIIQTINNDVGYYVLVDLLDPSKFILMLDSNQIQIYKVENGQIQVGEMRAKYRYLDENYIAYFDDHIYDLNTFWHHREINLSVLVWNLNNDEKDTVELDSLPENLIFAEFYDVGFCYEWVRDQIFVPIQFVLTDDYGITFADLQTKHWTVVNFAIVHPIHKMHFVNGKDLMIAAGENGKTKTYKLSMCKPDLLRNMAWMKLVNFFKKAKVDDPYAEARHYLPLNSDIQSFIFTDE